LSYVNHGAVFAAPRPAAIGEGRARRIDTAIIGALLCLVFSSKSRYPGSE